MLDIKDKAAAIRFTRVAQALSVLAAASAGAVAFVGVPSPKGSSPDTFLPHDAPPIEAYGAKVAAPTDAGATSARLGLIGNSPQPVAQVAVTPPPDEASGKAGTEPPPVAPPADDVITYLGPVRLGSRSMALLSIHGKQQFAGLNDRTDDGTVTEITPEHVTLTLGETTRTIERAARGSEVLTRVSAAAVANKGMNPAMGRNPVVTPQPLRNAGIQQPMTATQPPRMSPSMLFDDIRSRLKSTGQYQDEQQLDVAAKQELERQTVNGKMGEKGGGK